MTFLFSMLAGWRSKALAFFAVIAAFCVALVRAYFAGKARAKAEENQEHLKAVRKKKAIENEVDALDADALDGRYRRWLRDK